jgi:hypothetical protein
LGVISSFPGELEPVFQAMLENAVRLCEARFGTLFRFDGETFDFAAEVGAPPEYAEFQKLRGQHFQSVPGGPLEQIRRTKQVSHTADAAADSGQARQPSTAVRDPPCVYRCSRMM